jgi:glutamyl-tRNA synthetase
LAQVLGLANIEYAHVPLVVGADGRRLAKRHGDTRLSWYREHGVAPEQIVGWGAFSAGLIDQPKPLAAQELIERFDWGRVSKETVVLDRATTLRQFGFG